MRYEHGDRVVVVEDGKPRKARVVGHNTKLGRVSVTLRKDAAPVTYMVEDVFPLYRYGATQIALTEQGPAVMQELIPLMLHKPSDFAKKDES
jgi:hypothetical protein